MQNTDPCQPITSSIDPENSEHLRRRNLDRLFGKIANATQSFYYRHFQNAGILEDQMRVESFHLLPFTRKEDLIQDRIQFPPFGTNFTEPLENYTRFCQTSGTSSGMPMAVLDTPDSWQTLLRCWERVYEHAGVLSKDRLFFAFSFGPFLGFWSAFEAAAKRYLSIPGGGLSSKSRLEMMARYQVTVLCCTPTYALRLGELIGHGGLPSQSDLAVRKIIVAGEPGGSIEGTRTRLKSLWGEHVEIFDHHGMTEVGCVSYESPEHPRHLCILADSYYAEIINANGREVEDGEVGELVLTTLRRQASPLIRYRTGDLVRKRVIDRRLMLEGGILGRCDDMVVVRGVNLYPSALEEILLRHDWVSEFQIRKYSYLQMDEISIHVEVRELESMNTSLIKQRLETLEDLLKDTFQLRIPVEVVAPNSLPRAEFKSSRLVTLDDAPGIV